jgi:hypothetical protein
MTITSPSLRIEYGRELRWETVQVAGRTFRHVESCSCTTLVTYWPCGEAQP